MSDPYEMPEGYWDKKSPWNNPLSYDAEPEDPPMPRWGRYLWTAILASCILIFYAGIVGVVNLYHLAH